MGAVLKIWKNVLGDWKSSLKYQLALLVPISLLFAFVYVNGYYPSDAKTLQDRGWHQGLFLSQLGLVPYIFFYFFILAPLQELLFRKIFIDLGTKWFVDDNFWILNVFQAGLFASLRILYPFPLGIILLTFVLGLLFGSDYKQNKSLAILILSHFILAMMAITVNLI
jgi:membrane protease YdiL (CAAX protease family)